MKKFRGTENPAYIAGMRELRRSSASGFHTDKRTTRLNTKGARIRAAVREG